MKIVNCFVLAHSRYKKKKTKLLPTDFKTKLEYNSDLYATILVVNTKNSFAMHAVAWKIKKRPLLRGLLHMLLNHQPIYYLNHNRLR